MTPPQDSHGGRTPLGLRTEHQAKEGYSQALSFHLCSPLGFRLPQDLLALSSFLALPLGVGISILCRPLAFWKHITCLISRLPSQRAVCLRMNRTGKVTQLRFRWYGTETLGIQLSDLMWEWLKTSEVVGMYFAHEKNVTFGGPGGECYRDRMCVSPQIPKVKPKLNIPGGIQKWVLWEVIRLRRWMGLVPLL